MNTLATLGLAISGLAFVTNASSQAPEPATQAISSHQAPTHSLQAEPRIEPASRAAESAQAAQKKVVRWGPFKIPAATAEGPGIVDYPGFKLDMPCTNCFITTMHLDLLRDDGRPLNYGTTPSGRGSWTVINAAVPGVLCGAGGEVVYAGPNERTDVVLPNGYGYYNPPDSWWMAGKPILQNFSHEVITAYVQLTVSFVPAPAAMKPTTFIGFDQAGCHSHPPFYTIPQGYSDAHNEWIADRGGDIVAIVGHMHDYGISVAVENITTGQYLCTSIAGYADGSSSAPVGPGSGADALHPSSHYSLKPGNPEYAGHIEHMDVCFPKLHVKKGDLLRLHTQYNGPTPLYDVMGTAGIYMHVTDPPACTLTLASSYADNALRMLLHIGRSKSSSPTPASWNVWLTTQSGMTRLISAPLPPIDPPRPVIRVIRHFPSSGRIGLLTTVATAAGTLCSDWQTVDTGPVSSSARTPAKELAGLGAAQGALDRLWLESDPSTDIPAPSSISGACHLGEPALTQSHVPASAPGTAVPVLNGANGHYYEAVSVPEGIDCPRAEQDAAKRSFGGFRGHLATIATGQENDFLMANFPEVGGESGYWLGGYRPAGTSAPRGGWHWVAGDAMVYTNWEAGAPNAAVDQDAAIHFGTQQPGKWSDLPVVSTVGGYLVEYEPTCSVGVSATYDNGALSLTAAASGQAPTKWSVWLVLGRQSIPIVSQLPESGPPMTVSGSIPFPHLGIIGLLTTLTGLNGTVCSDWELVDTGPRSANSIPPIEKLRELFPKVGGS
jgi:hypothetical protein